MKIIFTLASLGSGGAERVVSLLSGDFVDKGHEVEIVCLRYSDYYYKVDKRVKVVMTANEKSAKGTDEQVTEEDSNVRYVENLQDMNRRRAWLRRHVCEEKPDVVIAFTEGVYLFTILALLGTHTPIISSERIDPHTQPLVRRLLKVFVLPFTNVFVVQTQAIKDYFPHWIRKKTRIVFNPVREEALKEVDSTKVHKTKTIISVARLYPQKRHEVLIGAFAKIAAKHQAWRLVIYGEGPERGRLTNYINEMEGMVPGLSKRIMLAGKTAEVVERLRESAVFALSSDSEGMSNAMIEAVCVGLPIVTTRVSGVKELVHEGENGYVVPCGDIEQMAERLDSLLDNDPLLQQFGQNSRKMREQFRIENIAAQWMQIIENIVK